MNTKVVTAAVLGTIAGLIGGFLIANGLNRSTINELKAQSEQREPASANSNRSADGLNVSPDEIKAKIAEADGNPQNFGFQKNLGLALYRYATMKQDTALLLESTRLLERANSIDPKDNDVIVGLGNCNFDIGYFKKDKAAFEKARGFYNKALAAKPDDADVRTDLALTYFLDEPADLARTATELNLAVKSDPKKERALQFLTQTYMRQGNWDEASKTLEKLKSVNPKSESIAGLAAGITAKEAPPVK